MWRYTYQDELYHYGIKGMKWGVRRTAAQLGHFIKDKAKKGYQTAKRAYGVHKATKKAKKEFESIMKKPLKDLTDDELMNGYRDMLNDYQVDVVVSGDLTEEEYAFSTLYLDVVAELERMGDYIINISEALDTATRS